MSRERWLRPGDEAVPFDPARARRASELGVAPALAHALYVQAIRRAGDAADAEALYLRYLHDTAARRSAASAELPVPGRQTGGFHAAARGSGVLVLGDLAHLAPGRLTRVQLEYPAGDAHPPGFDEVHGALDALAPGRAHAAPADPGALDARPHGAVAAAAPLPQPVGPRDRALDDAPPRGPGAPLSRPVGPRDRALDDASPRRPGAPLPADLASRLAPHVGRDAARAARLHTDDAADQIAAAHQARALTHGVDIFFARGEYAPGTARGDELLVHELTHVAQGQRGDLTRAAAKGIASGGTLDPAEAEADLRARLAVIELHAPGGAAPPLAPPQGQPTSDGERSSRIAAQHQRLGMAGQGAAPLTVAPAPPPTHPEAPVAHPPPQMAGPPAPASTGNAYVDAMSAPPSKQALELWAGAGARATAQATADQARFDAALPPVPVALDGGPTPGRKDGAAARHVPAPPPAAGPTPPAAQPTRTPPPPPVTTATTAAQQIRPTADKATIKADGQKLIDELPTTAPDVKTDPGPAPVAELAGQADPVRVIGDHQHAVGEGVKALDTARTKIITGPGSAQVQPVKLDEKLHVPREQATGALPPLPTVEGMAKLKQWNLPGNALAAFDTVAKPKMDAGLAQARAKMTEADTRRDADRDKAVSDAQGKVAQLHTDADHKQQARIADTRAQIANHQADTLVKHEAEVKKLDARSGDRKKAALGKINDRIAADQARAETDYKAAQQQAEAKKRQGEDEARKKKQEAQNKKQDESWWNQATDAVCDAIQSIADEIDKALQAIGQAIGQILDAVKDAACKAIDAARDFVCQALTEFGDWLKSQVDALIGSVFPELAAALDRLIDGVVNLARTAVNAIADGLKQAVTALCDSIKASLDGILAAFKAAVQAAATFAKAVVTGNWALVGKMILDGILNALGIDPAAFYALIGEAKDDIDKIVANPGAFVGHLIDAVKLGFKQFGANFWTHLKDGLVQWLFGTFAQAGITMPASFDIAGIFDLVCQILGLTWPRLRGKVVKLIGEKNTERLEFVKQYVQALITGGFAGLWQKIQGDLSNLWDMVVGGIRDWLIQSVVMAAIEKIATMWNPAGAIFELIKTAWNVYQWVRENAQRIFGLVEAVVHSISNIVAGNIGGAANFIEASLAKLVPIVIGLLANLLGLGGLADKIKSIIEKIQEKIDHAIDKLIDRVMKLFKGKGSKRDKRNDEDHGDPAVPKALAEPAPADVEDVNESLDAQLDQARPDQVIYQKAESDPKAATKALLTAHPDASFDEASGRLTLPPVDRAAISAATSLREIGEIAAQQTGVSKITISESEDDVVLYGHINPYTVVAKLVRGNLAKLTDADRRLLMDLIQKIADDIWQNGFRGAGYGYRLTSQINQTTNTQAMNSMTSNGTIPQPAVPEDDLFLAADQQIAVRDQDVFHAFGFSSSGITTHQLSGKGRKTDTTSPRMRGGVYPSYDDIINRLASAHVTGTEVAAALESMRLGHGIPPQHWGVSRELSMLRDLLFNVEVQRDSRNVLYSAMVVELLQSDPNMTLSRLVSRAHGAGLHPAAIRRAGRGYYNPPANPTSPTGIALKREAERRQVELLFHWFQDQLKNDRDLRRRFRRGRANLNEFEQYLRTWVKQHWQRQ